MIPEHVLSPDSLLLTHLSLFASLKDAMAAKVCQRTTMHRREESSSPYIGMEEKKERVLAGKIAAM